MGLTFEAVVDLDAGESEGQVEFGNVNLAVAITVNILDHTLDHLGSHALDECPQLLQGMNIWACF